MAVKPLKITVLADARQARKELSSFGSKLRGALGAGAALAGFAGITAGIKSVVGEASKAQQSLGATESVFGKFSDTVVKKSEQAASAVGLSANEYREYSNVLGALFKNQGVALGKLSGETSKHIGLASDLSAMYGGPVSDAVDAVSAAYKGEFNQLEKYGVSIKQATINTEADAIAKEKYGKALKDLAPKQEAAAKQLATQALLFKQTTDAAGTFKDEANTLAGQQQRLTAELKDASAEIGTALLPMLTDLAKFARKEVVPALEDFAEWLGENQDEIKKTGAAITGTILPPLKTLVTLVIDAAKWFAGLPGPVKEFAAQAAAAAYILPKLTSALQLVQAQAALYTTGVGSAAKRTALLSGALRNVAGVGGLTLLSQGLTDGKSDMASWGQSVAGGALAGAALGSVIPGVGTVIGGLGGAAVGASIELLTMKSASDRAKESAERAKPKFDDWAATLDQLTGSFTRNTREMVLNKLQTDGLVTTGNQLGITTRDLIDATLGRAGAMKRVEDAAKGNTDILRGLEHQKLTDFIRQNRNALQGQQTDLRNTNRDLKTMGQAYRGLPKKLITKIAAEGTDISISRVRKLAKQYNINPKKLITKISADGVEITGRKVKGLQTQLKGLGNVKPSNKWLQLYAADLTTGTTKSRKGGSDMAKGLREGTAKARPDLSPFRRVFTGDLSGLQTTATSGGQGIGSNMGSALNSGIYAWAAPVAATAAFVVRNAMQAARNEAKIKSPSRVTMKIGSQIGEGLEKGVAGKGKAVKDATLTLIRKMMKSFTKGSTGISKATSKIQAAIDKVLSKKYKGKALKAHTRAVKRALADEYKALKKNGKAQHRMNARLEKARGRLATLKKTSADYAKGIRDAAISYASVTNLDTAFNSDAMLAKLQQRLAKLRQFASVIKDLIERGLNQTMIDQLSQAGVEGGLASALAIQQGGQSAVDEFNAVQVQINSVAGTLGQTAADDMYAAGIKAAQGLVNGLNSQAKELDKWARKLAQRLAKAVKDALGIKSPSRVFQEIGKQTVDGLRIGLDETYVKRAGSSLAASLQDGFSKPTLTAKAAYTGSGSSSPSGNTYQITVQAPVGSNPAEIGRQISGYITAYERAGGRRAS